MALTVDRNGPTTNGANPLEPAVKKLTGQTNHYYWYMVTKTVSSVRYNPYTGKNEPYTYTATLESGAIGPYVSSTERDMDMLAFNATLNTQYKGSGCKVYTGSTTLYNDDRYVTGTRKNTHADNVFKLGYGWSFGFPSIENITDAGGKNDFLHVGDGRVYKINSSANGLEGYDLNDLKISKSGGKYTLVYKDGKKAFFDSKKRLARLEDRFGNPIKFDYHGDGSLREITDTAGRRLVLEPTAEGSKWVLYDRDDPSVPSAGLDLVKYKIDASNNLVAVTDQEGRVTKYGYGTMDAATRLLDPNLTSFAHVLLIDGLFQHEILGKTLAVVDRMKYTEMEKIDQFSKFNDRIIFRDSNDTAFPFIQLADIIAGVTREFFEASITADFHKAYRQRCKPCRFVKKLCRHEKKYKPIILSTPLFKIKKLFKGLIRANTPEIGTFPIELIGYDYIYVHCLI